MSGHSKWSTIKRKKEVTDIARGKVFSKHSKAITVAVKQGGGKDPSGNYKLRIAIDQAKADNMPKSNIDKAINKGDEAGNIEEIVYEGFGPSGVNIMVVVATDNRNRTGQEIKNIFDKGGGRMGGPGSVSFNFEAKGVLIVEKATDADGQLLELIDLGAEDVEVEGNAIEVFTSSSELGKTKEVLESSKYKVRSAELIYKPKTTQKVEDKPTAVRIVKLLQTFDDCEDVQNVYTNASFGEELIKDLD